MDRFIESKEFIGVSAPRFLWIGASFLLIFAAFALFKLILSFKRLHTAGVNLPASLIRIDKSLIGTGLPERHLHVPGNRPPVSETELERMAKEFFGYGRWNAPFWFIGPEPGMANHGDSLEQRYRSWERLGFEPIVDCAAHHRGFGFTKWHQETPPTVPTWRQLIRILLTYQGQPNDIEAIRTYQRKEWGSSNGETCVIELSGLAAPNMRAPQDRATLLSKRIERIREEALTHTPEIIVMYGEGQRAEWERIVDAKFDSKGLSRIGKTVVAIASHPVTRGLTNDYWVKLGQLLRRTTAQGSN